MYKNIFSLLLLFLFASDVYAACKTTKRMLTSRTGPEHDEYLYKNTRERENRKTGKKGDAFICGYVNEYDGCPVGETLRLKNAAVGSDFPSNDAVFICSGGDDNYYWETIIVESECTSSQPVENIYDNELKLYKVGNKYCEKVSDIQTTIFLNDANKFLNELDGRLSSQNINLNINLSGYTASSGISGSDLFNKIKVEIERQEFSQAEKDFIINAINDSANNTNVNIDELESQLAGLQWNLTKTQAQLVLTQLITKANQTNIAELKSQLESLKTQVNDNMTKEQVMELVVEKLDTRQFNNGEIQTIQTMLSDVVADLGFTDQRLQYQIDNLTSRVTDLEADMGQTKTELIKLKGYFADLKSLTGAQTQQIQQLFTELDNVTTTQEFKDKVQEIIDSSYVSNEFKTAVADVIKNHDELKNMQIDLSMVKDTLYEHGEMIDYLDEFTTNLKESGDERYDKIWDELEKVKDSITSEEDIILTIEYLISYSELNDTEISQVKNEINKALSQLDYVNDDAFNRLKDKVKDIKIRQNFTESEISDLRKIVGDLDARLSVFTSNLSNVTDIVNYAMNLIDDNTTDIKELFEQLRNISEDILTSEDFVSAVENIVSQENLNEAQIKDVKNIINQTLSDLGYINDSQWQQVTTRLDNLEIRVAMAEGRIDYLEVNVNGMLSEISGLKNLTSTQKTAIEQLRNAINDYSTPEQVYEWIKANYNIFSNDQLEKIHEIAEKYIDAKLSSFNARMNTMEQQHESERKILSAMSILNAFDASSKESVWRNKDGKFNTARLASDATAGVILGTAGGLISNKLIKKNQVKKGFENIGCYVGGQQIAEYGDEFTVGMN